MNPEPLEPRKLAFIREVANGKTPTQAAYAVGYSSTGAGSRLMADDRVREAWKQAVIEKWGTVGDIVEDVYAGARAERIELDKLGDEHNLGPDWHARAKYHDMVLKSMGMYPNPRLDVQVGTQNVLVIDSARSPLAALDPFGSPSIEGESRELPALGDAELGIAPEDDFLIG